MGGLGSSIKSLELFGESFSLKIKEGDKNVYSWMGFTLTIFLSLIMLVFLYGKITVLALKKDVDVMSVTVENALDFEYKFDAEQGFFIAAALTEYDSNTEIIEEPEVYGKLVFE